VPRRSAPAAYADRVGDRRFAAARARGGSEDTERAVQAALRWLVTAQSPDGRWNAAEHGGSMERSMQGHHRQGVGTRSDHGVTGLALLAWWLLRGRAWRQAKLFEWAAVLYFLLAPLVRDQPPLDQASLLLPLLLGLLALGSVVAGHPATLDYARLMTGPEWWNNPHFIRVNRWLTLIWACSFLAAAALRWLSEGVNPPAGLALGGLTWALYAAAGWYTVVYPRWYRLHRYLPLVRAGLVSLIETHLGRGSVCFSGATAREALFSGRILNGTCAVLGTRRDDPTGQEIESIAAFTMHGIDVLVLVDDPSAQSCRHKGSHILSGCIASGINKTYMSGLTKNFFIQFK
jgi:hypothetical protein